MFSFKDMKKGLALYLVSELRDIKKSDGKFYDYCLSSPSGSEQMDTIVNMFFASEYHIPRMVSSTEISEGKKCILNRSEHRKITVTPFTLA